jgi:hypothetical protein
MQTLQIYGERNFRLSTPAPRLTRSRRDVDELDESWQADREDAFAVGDPHPERSGMILDRAVCTEEAPGQAYVFDLSYMGSADGSKPTKVLHNGSRVTLDPGWHERTRQVISWHAEWKYCTATEADDVVTTEEPHGFIDGQLIYFKELSGGAGITPQSSSSLGVALEVTDRTTNTFKLAIPGGAAVDITTDMIFGLVIAADFALGSQHPDHAYMFLVEKQIDDDETDWKRAGLVYRGLEGALPFKQIVTVNGAQFSSSEPITVSLPGGWPSSPEYTNFHLPEVVVTELRLTTTAPDTGSIPVASTPANAPAIQSLTISAPNLTYNYPYGWSFMGAETVDTLNIALPVYLTRYTFRYIWPVMFR